MFSLPIPYARSPVRYQDLVWSGRSIGELVERLTRGNVHRTDFAHLDPDLRPELRPRPSGWRPALGQHKSAQGHLRQNHVCPGDLFLFWGLFRRFDDSSGWQEQRLHVLWGWLQIDAILQVDRLRASSDASLRWTRNHPHFDFDPHPANTLYVATERLIVPGDGVNDVPGAGVFETFRPHLQLTAAGSKSPGLWSLPRYFHPGSRRPLTHHPKPERWRLNGDRVLLESAARGQEFVLDASEYPEVLSWVADLFRRDGSVGHGKAQSPS